MAVVATGRGRNFTYRVNVYNSALTGLFKPGGSANKEASQISVKIEARAVAKAVKFSRTGEIARSHRRNVVPSGIYGVRAYVYNTAPHAE